MADSSSCHLTAIFQGSEEPVLLSILSGEENIALSQARLSANFM